jgi:CubicO group peptidase (beta-lactamase class C family)
VSFDLGRAPGGDAAMSMPADASGAADDLDIGGLDELAGRAMQTWQVPGLAFGIVRSHRPPLLRTYGVRDIATQQPVDARTRFATCSLTKSLTAAGLLLLLDGHGLADTTRVTDLLPDFSLSDAAATRQLTLRDLLTHTSGLPRHDRIWTPGDLARDEMIRRMRHLALAGAVGERFLYNNLGYVVLSSVVERLDGRTWEDFTTATLLQPLGFRDSGWSPPALEHEPNHAHPHCRERDTLHRGRIWPAPAPSGGLTASIADMVLWAGALLGTELPGVANDRWEHVRTRMTTPGVLADAPAFPELDPGHYGLGLCCQHYRGRRVISHTGSMPGWGSLLAYLPGQQVGLVVLTNRDSSPVPQLLAYSLFDSVCKLAPIDWHARFAQARRKALAEERAEQERQAASATPAAGRPLSDYAGRYSEPAYGVVEVCAGSQGPSWTWRGLGGPMHPLGGDVFSLRETPPARHVQGFVATFRFDAAGRAERIEIPHEPEVAPIAFRREASGHPHGERLQ